MNVRAGRKIYAWHGQIIRKFL